MIAPGSNAELSVSPLELFFDLVFVFGVTQTAALIALDQTLSGVLGGVLVFFMLWWAWQQYTWGINGVGNERPGVRLTLVLAMGLSLFMALVVTDAYGDDGRLFGVAYALVLFVGLALFYAGLSTVEDRRTLLTYLPIALLGGVVVLVGSFLDPPWRTAAWAAGMGLELAATVTAGGADFKIKQAHFAERHGLFVILALGESIVAIGLSAVEGGRTAAVGIALSVSFLGTVAVWWLYFGRFAGWAEHALWSTDGARRTVLARDVYTMGHFPVTFGIVLYAVVAEEVVAHPSDALGEPGRRLLAAAVTLIILGMMVAAARAGVSGLWERALAGGVAVVGALVLDLAGWVAVSVFVVATAIALAVEGRRLEPVRSPHA